MFAAHSERQFKMTIQEQIKKVFELASLNVSQFQFQSNNGSLRLLDQPDYTGDYCKLEAVTDYSNCTNGKLIANYHTNEFQHDIELDFESGIIVDYTTDFEEV